LQLTMLSTAKLLENRILPKSHHDRHWTS
jgi:hypothetical protein